VRVEDSVRAGLVLSGLTTSVSLLDVHVDGVEADSAGELGYGLVVDGGGSVWDAVEGGVEVEGGSIRDAVRVGVFVDHGHLEARDLEVLDTRTYNGHYGRGLHLQGASTAELEGLEVRGNNDVGLFALMVAELSVTGSVFAETISGEAVPGFPDLGITGDGLVATQGGFGAEPSLWSLNLEDNEFVGNGRAGALVEDVSVVIGDDNLFEGNGIVSCGSSFPLGPGQDALLWQGSAEVAGPAVEVGGNTGFSALGFDSTPLEADGLDE